jgi:alkanesulfonate monooxygenase SsuD/methylene tetrahydromethanopterin reductase-like flavin-dependent oxidoreductase (luciferase family)
LSTVNKSIAIGLGITEFPFSGAQAFWRWVDLCEQGGIDSVWQTDRLVSREPILECMTMLAAVAGRTKRLKFGVNVVSLAMRDPLLLAKQCATIDVLSDGRLLPGFGIGSPRGPEWVAMHLDTTTRGRRTDEALEIISRLWSQDSVDFDGRHNKLTAASISPKPVQKELPIWIGGPETPAQIAPVIAAIRTAAIAAGRPIDEDHYGAAFPFHFGSADDPGLARAMEAFRKRTGQEAADYFAIGDAETIMQRIDAYVEAGAQKFILRPMARDDEGMMAATRHIISEIVPRVAARWPKPAKAA